MTEDRKHELEQLLDQAMESLEIHPSDYSKKRYHLSPISVDQYKNALRPRYASPFRRHLPAMKSAPSFRINDDYEIHIANETIKSKLLDFIKEEFAQFILENRIQSAICFFTPGKRTDGYPLDRLLKQLLKIAIVHGIEKAVSDFNRCTENTRAPFQNTALLKGIKIQEEIQVFERVRLLPIPNLLSGQVSHEMRHEMRALTDHLPEIGAHFLHETHSLLIIDDFISPMFLKPPPKHFQNDNFPFRAEEVIDRKLPKANHHDFYDLFCKAMSLAYNTQITTFIMWTSLPDDLLFNLNGHQYSSTGASLSNSSKVFTVNEDEEINEAKRLYKILVNLDPVTRKKLQVPINRWLSSKPYIGVHTNNVDKIINLGIALEALYLSDRDGNSEISFQFRLRAAWHLGKGKEDREKLIDVLKAIYTLRSKAVHNGEISEKIKIRKGEEPIDTSEFIKKAQDLCRDSIIKIIETGEFPDWNDLILGEESS